MAAIALSHEYLASAEDRCGHCLADQSRFLALSRSDIYAEIHDLICAEKQRTASQMASLIEPLDPDERVLELGSAWPGERQVVALTASSRHERSMTSRLGVESHGMPFHDCFFGAVWSQDAGIRPQMVSEVARVLRCGGVWVLAGNFLDQAVHAPVRRSDKKVFPYSSYEYEATKAGLQAISHHELTPRFVALCSSALEAIDSRSEELEASVGRAELERTSTRLHDMLEGAQQGRLAWGISLFRKVVT